MKALEPKLIGKAYYCGAYKMRIRGRFDRGYKATVFKNGARIRDVVPRTVKDALDLLSKLGNA